MTDQYQIRRLNAEDWQLYREIRLEALEMHPAYFSPSKDESKFTEADWKDRLGNANAASFGLFKDGSIIGLTGIVKDRNDPTATIAHLVSSYIKSQYRKQGLSRMFYEARIQWAKEQNIKTLILEHRDDNLPSQRAHQKFGFRLVASSEEKWPDGALRPALKYQLDL